MKNQTIIESYKKHFSSPFGAYVYMYLNQNKPEFFSIHSDKNSDTSNQIEFICRNANNLDDIIKKISNISSNVFDHIQNLNCENELTKPDVLNTLRNISFLDLNDNDWTILDSLIEFNNFSVFINDKKKIQQKLNELAKHFSMRSISINPNYNPEQFITDLKDGIEKMCDTLGLKYNQVGLNALELNYKNEQGDFTGYVDYGNNEKSNIHNKVVINKLSVFAHEWMHFIESSLGFQDLSLTELINLFDSERFSTIFSTIDNIGEFSNVLNKVEVEIKESNENDFVLAMISASHFFEPYALNKENFKEDITNIAKKLYSKIKNNEDNVFTDLQYSVKVLLSEKHPTRYFSFLETQCEQEIKLLLKQKFKQNQFIDFSRQADKRLKEYDYSASIIETFARSFEQFVFNKVEVPCSVVASSYDSDFYPQGSMKENFKDFWEKSWVQIKDLIDAHTLEDPKVMNPLSVLNNITKFREKLQKFKGDKSFKSSDFIEGSQSQKGHKSFKYTK